MAAKQIFQNKEIADLFLPFINQGYPSRKDFGDTFVNGIKHWWFPNDKVKQSYSSDQLMILDLEFGSKCGLRCDYCYRTDDKRDVTPNGDFTLDEWKNLIDQAADMGVKAVKLIGAGEFFEEKEFMPALRYLTDKGIKAVLFTAGYVLDDEEKTKRLHGMTPDEIIDYLYENNHTIFIKADSFRKEVMDSLVHRPGFTESRNKVLIKLIKRGFTNETPTRLGFEVQVNIHNYNELTDIDRLKYYLNIYSDMVTSMPCGLYYLTKANGNSIDLTIEQKRQLYLGIYRQNIEYDIPFDRISPFIGGLCCTQLGNGLYINVKGEVYSCPGFFENLGSIRNSSLKEIWLNHKKRKIYQTKGYICPPRQDSGITPTELYLETERQINRK
ncbi:MAG: radical SAM protein [Nanoarchaeota archaeon]|nr:radical SAM protein [Nanoarchaeota archaeon]